MDESKLIISVIEARKILGKDAETMTDQEISDVISTIDLLAKDALDLAIQQLHRKKDAKELAEVIYDVYQEQKGPKNHTQE